MSDRDQQSVASTSRPGSPVPPLPDFSNARPYRFAWDAATRKADPASVSGTTEGRGDYFVYKPSLSNFNFSSTSLAVGAIPSDWSSAKHGFNAISTLVNNPHKKSAPPKAHAPVPPTVPSQLPRVRRKDFDGYLKSVAPDWEQFETALQSNQQETQADAFAAGLAEMDLEPPATPRTPRLTHRTSIPSLDSVPSVFFDSSFDLCDSKTFAAVTEHHDGDGGAFDPSTASHSLPLLEKLSHYADTIELHLIREISRRSPSFFAALTNLNELQTESSQCLKRIRKLRGMLHDVDEKSAKRGLEVIRLERKVKNLEDVKEGVKTMQSVGEMLSLARSLGSGGEWDAALGLIEGLQRLWNGEDDQQLQADAARPNSNAKAPSKLSKRNSTLVAVPESIAEESEPTSLIQAKPPAPRIPLSSVHAFSLLPEHLRMLTSEIAASLTSELITVLKTDLLNQMDTPSVNSQESMSEKVDEAGAEKLTMLRDRVRPLGRGLQRTNALKDTVQKWTTVALVEIRLGLKKHLPSAEELDEEDADASAKADSGRRTALRDVLREMSHGDFMLLLRRIFGTLLRGIQELQTQNAILLEVVPSPQLPESSTVESPLQADLSDLLSSVTELAHSGASKVLNMRAEQHAALDLSSFLDVFNETWNFVVGTETICRRMIVGLRGAAVSQAKAFLQTMHQIRITQSSKLVEEEQWSAADVSAEAQTVVNTIVDSAVRDSPELVVSQTSVTSPSRANGAQTSSKHLTIEGRKYFAVPATLSVIGLLLDYLKVIVNLSLLTTDTVGRVIEFLKAFNSRTCQVVLGAGAMRSAGLKNITAKHLALASQSLSIVIALIPYVRECFRRHLNPKQAVMLVEFDKLKRDYQEHQQEIHAKLIAIMGDRLNAHCKSLQNVDWSALRSEVNEYMTVLVKETVTLHKVLSRYLQEAALEYIMSQVFAAINHRLSEEYNKIDLPGLEAKERLLRDARYLHQNFSNLKNVNASFGMLEIVIGEKRFPGQGPAQSEQSKSKSPPPPTAPGVNDSPRQQTQAQTQSLAASTMESANERLRGIFRRTSTFKASSPKAASNSQQTPSPIAEKQNSPFFPEKASVDEPAARTASPPPPPTPEKAASDSNAPATMRPSSPLSPAPSEGRNRSRSRSPRPMEKALPIPLPTLDSDGNIVDPPEAIELPQSPPMRNGQEDSAKAANGVNEGSSEASDEGTSTS
ncbi:Vps54-domain-containing protein [Fomitiporia mediterranea MF3/22]|uniref:Vps54-domain-containing protein n=1 Tax=Fomitiporia mediterranea (strain MF3/22) TaxID=694068 RepID=UPI0004409AAA|nr:Vps54-domain-containing protein [Fomitiporia mediterranea MF3/22]EJD05695.1 Vps54-domain-containing protein [Fomitiporia mediterranea MF3/22]